MKLFTDAEKSQIASLLDNVAETFAQPLYYYKQKDTLTLSADGNFNYAYGQNQANVVQTTEFVSGVISGRIYYPDPNKYQYLQPNIPITSKPTQARLKLNVSDYETIKDAKHFILPDGQTYNLVSSLRPIGPFSIHYISIILESAK